MNKISCIVVVKGNPRHIFESIDSVKDFVSEIIIVDIGINQELKNKLRQNSINQLIEWNQEVAYVELIREKIKKYAKNEIILFLDPDEIIPEKLKTIIKKEVDNCDYLVIPRKNIIFGKWITHSRWWPDYQIRLFKKQNAIWPTEIHKQPQLSGKGITVDPQEENAIIHHNYENIDEYLSKLIRYAKAEGKTKAENNVNYHLSEAVTKAISEFISRFFGGQGYKDGAHGLVLSFFQMFYPMIVFFYFWEAKNYEAHSQDNIVKQSSNFFTKGCLETNYWINKENLNQKNNILRKTINFLLKKII